MSLPVGVPLSQIPAGKPPGGTRSNFTDPPNLASATIAVSTIMMFWALSFVGMRFYANMHAPRGLGVDDYFCLIGTVFAVAYTSMVLSLLSVARHSWDIPVSYFDNAYFKRSYAQGMLLGPTLFFAKGAILLLYLRIFTINKKMKYSIWFGLAFDFVLYWINIPFESWYCAPRAGDPWSLETVGKTCPDNIIFGLVQGVLAVALDLYIFILPIPVVMSLQMSLQRRISVLSIFATAFLGITAAVVAMVYRTRLYKTTDVTWATASLYICITCENYVAIIVSSMPALASLSREPLFRWSWLASARSRFLKSFSSASRSKSSVPYAPTTDIYPSNEAITMGARTRDSGYHELGNGPRTEKYELGPMTPRAMEAAKYPE